MDFVAQRLPGAGYLKHHTIPHFHRLILFTDREIEEVKKRRILKALSKYNVLHDNNKQNQLNMKHIVFNGKNMKHPKRMLSNKQMPLCCFFFFFFYRPPL